MRIVIKNGTIISANRLLKNSTVVINGPKIISVGKTAPHKKASVVIDARGAFISPGFIDTHIHGSPGDITANETKYGTTSFMIAVSCGRQVPDICGHHNVLGIRLEGPYINPMMAGAQDKRFIKAPSVTGLEKTIKMGAGTIKMITLAPELKGATTLIRICLKHNIIPSIGHSDATYAEAQGAFSAGIRHVTHIFNAISGPRHGTAGASTAAIFDGRVMVEVIADLKHVKASLLKTLFALKDKNSVILITDSVRAEGSSYPQRRAPLRVPYGYLHIYGYSHIIDCVRNVVKHCGVSLVDAVRMASLNPALAFGVARNKGTIAAGKDADIVIFDKNFDVKMTMIRGRIAFVKGKICAG